MRKYEIEYVFEQVGERKELVVYIGNPDGDLKISSISTTIKAPSNAHIKEHFALTVNVTEDPLGSNPKLLRFESTDYFLKEDIPEHDKLKERYLTIYCVVNTTKGLPFDDDPPRRRTRTTVSNGTKDD